MVQVSRSTAPLTLPDSQPAPKKPKVSTPQEKPALTQAGPAATYQSGGKRGTANFDPTSELCSMENPKACTNPHDTPKNFFINGIRTSEQNARSNTDLISKNLGQPVEMVYNPTKGTLADAAEAMQNIVGADTAISRKMQSRLRETLDSGQKVRVFSHSQGSAITGDALHKLAAEYKAQGKTPAQVKELMGRVEVISFGGFADKESFPAGVKFTLKRDKGDHVAQMGSSFQAVGRSYKEVAANPKKVENWGQLAGSVGKTVFTMGKAVIVNASEAAESAYKNRDKLDKALGNGKFVKELEKGDLAAAGACINKPALDEYCAQIGEDVASQHLTVVVKNNQESGYINDYFKEQKAAS